MSLDFVLDLRHHPKLATLADYTELCEGLQHGLVGHPIRGGTAIQLEDDEGGRIGLTLMGSSHHQVALNTADEWRIYSLLERPEVRFACAVCARAGVSRHGSQFCHASAERGEVVWLCGEHARMLDGTLRAFHPERLPVCTSKNGQQAAFWCTGPICRAKGGRPWSAENSKAHPADQAILYCKACHADLFAPCSATHCGRIGYFKCEYIDVLTKKRCSAHCCARHNYEWRIYGGQTPGLSLCSQHKDRTGDSDEEVIGQILLATAARSLRVRDAETRGVFLPSLGACKYMLLHARHKSYSFQQIFQLFTKVHTTLTGSSSVVAEARRIYHRKRPLWERDLAHEANKRQGGETALEQLKQAFRGLGLSRVANTLRLGDFIPQTPDRSHALLFVYVDEAEIGLFLANKGRLANAVPFRFDLERDQPGVKNQRRGRR